MNQQPDLIPSETKPWMYRTSDERTRPLVRFEFRAYGEPKGQPRPRAFARKFGGKWQARVYDAGTAENWKSLIAEAVRPFVPFPPILGPVRLDAVFYFQRPKAHYRSNGVELKHTAPTRHVGKPDRDNLEKALLDALKQIGVFKDDSQVCDGPIVKLYETANERPGVRVTVEEMEP